MEQHPLEGAGGLPLDPPAMVDGAQAEAAREGAPVMQQHPVEGAGGGPPDPPAMVDGGEGAPVMEQHPVEGAGGRPTDPPAMVDGALAEEAGDGALAEATGDGALADDVGNGAQAEAIELGAPAPAKPKRRYVHPICYDDTVVASLILSDPPMGEGPVYQVEGPAVQVEEPVDPLPCLGRQSRSIVYSGDGCVSRGEKNPRFWRQAMRDFGGAPELLLGHV